MSNKPIPRLRQERERRGWSRNYIAEQIKVDVVTVGRWERGERLPHPIYRQNLCDLFEMNAEQLGLFLELSQQQDEEAVDLDRSSPKDVFIGESESQDDGDASDPWNRENLVPPNQKNLFRLPVLQSFSVRKTLLFIGLVFLLVAGSAGLYWGKTLSASQPASASVSASSHTLTTTPPSAISAKAFSCPSRSICLYKNENGTGAQKSCPVSACRGAWYHTTVGGVHAGSVYDDSHSIFYVADVQAGIEYCELPNAYGLYHSYGYYWVEYGVTSCADAYTPPFR